MRVVDLIHKKRQGRALTEEEIRFLIRGYTDGLIPDYQMSAFAMAVFFRGMDDAETAVLTDAMMRSGDTVDLSRFGSLSVDKHSTGGVGDKTTLIVAPVVAALGCKMAKMSGRGLGHTGGTVDKLEAIPGFRTTLTPEEFLAQVERIGVAVVGQSGDLTPADKKLYALRDVTDTVDSLPLIASSVMSKKLAAGAKSIVLDVKVGSGAFLKTEEQGRKLAGLMTEIGRRCGRNVAALLTDMDVPLGMHVGNALEVREAAEVLKGRGSADLAEVCKALAAHLVSMAREIPVPEAEKLVTETIASGKAFLAMKEWISAQGGDAEALEDYSRLPQAKVSWELRAPRAGHLHAMDAQAVGEASAILGAGRTKKEDPIDYAAGIVLAKKTGDAAAEGETLATFYTDRPETIGEAAKRYLGALRWGDAPPQRKNLILGVVGGFG